MVMTVQLLIHSMSQRRLECKNSIGAADICYRKDIRSHLLCHLSYQCSKGHLLLALHLASSCLHLQAQQLNVKAQHNIFVSKTLESQ